MIRDFLKRVEQKVCDEISQGWWKRFKIHNINDIAETAIRQFEDYGFDISEKGRNITYSNMTVGQHDDFVSASYFAVADITASDVAEIANFYSDENIVIINNKNTVTAGLKNSFF